MKLDRDQAIAALNQIVEHELAGMVRYTQYSLRRLAEEAGFDVVRIEWLEGYLGTVAHQFHQMYRWLPSDLRTIRSMGVGWRGIYVAPMILLTRFLAGRLRAPFARADIAWK